MSGLVKESVKNKFWNIRYCAILEKYSFHLWAFDHSVSFFISFGNLWDWEFSCIISLVFLFWGGRDIFRNIHHISLWLAERLLVACVNGLCLTCNASSSSTHLIKFTIVMGSAKSGLYRWKTKASIKSFRNNYNLKNDPKHISLVKSPNK